MRHQVRHGIATLDANGSACFTWPAGTFPANAAVVPLVTPLGAPMPHLHVIDEVRATADRACVAGGVAGKRVKWAIFV